MLTERKVKKLEYLMLGVFVIMYFKDQISRDFISLLFDLQFLVFCLDCLSNDILMAVWNHTYSDTQNYE